MEKYTVTLDMEHIQTIANMFDLCLKAHGIQVAKQITPVLNLLDEAVKEGLNTSDHEDVDLDDLA